MISFRAVFAALALTIAIGPALAVQPGEMLADPALEARARTLSAELRCMVCQNQSIDDSDAELAHDLRVLVRERLAAGDTDAEVLDFVVARYGEFALLKPRFSARNALLWGTPVVLLALGGLFALVSARSKRRTETALSDEEKAALGRILGEGGSGQGGAQRPSPSRIADA
ncbi:cytochrome c-type biogenesis protein CcmH [Mesorhizobium sp. CN2-181]|uniref:cytochrome c-type biogenesis protein n=1 Tax=Mesorhizobium yinganensis TaxID=3157707 RepID=UPI0032B82B44